jgi:hypothetical protein
MIVAVAANRRVASQIPYRLIATIVRPQSLCEIQSVARQLGAAMNFKNVIAGGLLLVLSGAATAQQANDRIDLDAIAKTPRIAGLPFVRPAAAQIGFADSEAVCPERHGNLQISGGELRLHQLFTRSYRPVRSFPSRDIKPVDDESYQYEIASEDCRIQLVVRLQVRQDGVWTSLPLPWTARLSIPPDEKRAMLNELIGQSRERAKSRPPAENSLIGRKPVQTMLGDGLSGLSEAFFFEGAPTTCVDAVGTYALDGDGATFSFMAGLPGHINHFVIERADADAYQGRLYFLQGDCRYEITIGMWLWYHYDWAPLRLALIPPLK